MNGNGKDMEACEGGVEECGHCHSDACDSRKAPAGSQADERRQAELRLKRRMASVARKIVVLSGKGGVGKSTVAVNLALSLARRGKRVGLMDIDIHGPSIPTMLGLVGEYSRADREGIIPVECHGLKVMSVQFFMEDPDAAVIWRGPMKMTVISQFLSDVNWGELDYLVVDSPPGTGDEPLSIVQLLDGPDGAVIVTTPQKVAEADVRKSINFCHQLKLPVLGIVENMSGFACPHCGETTAIFQSGAGKRMADDFGIPFLGGIPFELKLGASGEEGQPYVSSHADSPAAALFQKMAAEIEGELEDVSDNRETHMTTSDKEKGNLKIVVPVSEGRLSMHFGHCETFAMLDVNLSEKRIDGRTDLEAPPHEPGLLPRWLAERGAQMIIAGGMGQRAQTLFEQSNIAVLVGAPSLEPEVLVEQYLNGTLTTGDNVCDH